MVNVFTILLGFICRNLNDRIPVRKLDPPKRLLLGWVKSSFLPDETHLPNTCGGLRFAAPTLRLLEYIRENGFRSFLDREKEKWRCPECGETICCHNGICFHCGLDKLKAKKKKYRWEDD
jgi:hypothetical protein